MSSLPKNREKEVKAIASQRDSEIDFSDAAEVRDWSGAVVGKFYRPVNTQVCEKSRLRSDGGRIRAKEM